MNACLDVFIGGCVCRSDKYNWFCPVALSLILSSSGLSLSLKFSLLVNLASQHTFYLLCSPRLIFSLVLSLPIITSFNGLEKERV